MRRLPAILFILSLAALPALSQGTKEDRIPYLIEFSPEKDVTMLDRHKNKEGLFINVKFKVRLKKGFRDFDSKRYKIHILEDGEFRKEVDVPAPHPSEGLSVVLAVDTSASIKESGMHQVRLAVDAFFQKLPEKADCGLILINSKTHQTIDLSLNRGPIRDAIRAVQPEGGNKCLDGAAEGIAMLKKVKGDKAKALVLISNGLDQHSETGTKAIIDDAKKHHIKIHTIGIGEASVPQVVNTILVLDHSGSMELPADDNEKSAKIKGLHEAGAHFIDMIPYSARTTLIPFGSVVETAKPFTGDKELLKQSIQNLRAEGETALFDALFSALGTLDAYNPPGKRVVVAMTDGIDNISRRRVDEVVERAKEANISLYLLGFGREKELDARTMTFMAEQTGGQYFHARNQKALFKFFEDLSFKINEQGIDEKTLIRIATETGGKYNHARNIKDLPLIMKAATGDIEPQPESQFFLSRRQVRDGKLRKISLKLVRTAGGSSSGSSGPSDEVLDTREGAVQTHGVVIAQMDHLVYLGLLAALGSLIALPAFLRRKSESEPS